MRLNGDLTIDSQLAVGTTSAPTAAAEIYGDQTATEGILDVFASTTNSGASLNLVGKTSGAAETSWTLCSEADETFSIRDGAGTSGTDRLEIGTDGTLTITGSAVFSNSGSTEYVDIKNTTTPTGSTNSIAGLRFYMGTNHAGTIGASDHSLSSAIDLAISAARNIYLDMRQATLDQAGGAHSVHFEETASGSVVQSLFGDYTPTGSSGEYTTLTFGHTPASIISRLGITDTSSGDSADSLMIFSGNKIHFKGGTTTFGTPHMTLDATGQLGIGVSDPAEQLEVDGNILLTYGSATTRSFQCEDPSSGLGDNLTVRAGAGSGSNTGGSLYLTAGDSAGSPGTNPGAVYLGYDPSQGHICAVAVGGTEFNSGLTVAPATSGDEQLALGLNGTGSVTRSAWYFDEVTTTDATQTTHAVAILTNSTSVFEVLISARRTDVDGESAAYKLTIAAANDAGTSRIVGSLIKVVIGEDTAAWDVTAEVNDTTDTVDIKVTGEALKTIDWGILVTRVQVQG